MDEIGALRMQLQRQIVHWQSAVLTLDDADSFASSGAWASLEQYLGVALRQQLRMTVQRLRAEITGLAAQLESASTTDQLVLVRRRVLNFRRRFLQVETTLDFYGDAVNSRTSPKMGSILKALDFIAGKSMEAVLKPLGRDIPPVLTYVDKGLGASILRAGMRLWDQQTISPVAAIKVTRHNLYRPTSLVHETGHQVAAILDWTNEYQLLLQRELAPTAPREVVRGWMETSSEIVADVFAFAHCGYGAVAALHDVVAAESSSVFRYVPGDPHPLPYIRVLLNVEFCRRMFGAGPWDDLAAAWRQVHPLSRAMPGTRRFLEQSEALLPRIVEISLFKSLTAFGGRPIVELVHTSRVKPDALVQWSGAVGTSVRESPYWSTTDPVRLLALTSYQFAMEPHRAAHIAQEYEAWTRRVGSATQAA